MLTLRARIFVFTGIIALIILGVAVALLIVRRQQNKPVTPDTTSQDTTIPTGSAPLITQPLQTDVQTTVPAGIQVKQQTTAEATQSSVKQLAKIFVERYGSYSTDSNFQNIRDVQGQVTQSLWSTLSARLNTVPAKGMFTGVTTQVITVTMLDWKDTTATLELKAQLTTTKDTTTSVSYTTYTVGMVKQGMDWLVDSFTTSN